MKINSKWTERNHLDPPLAIKRSVKANIHYNVKFPLHLYTGCNEGGHNANIELQPSSNEHRFPFEVDDL